MTQAVPEGLAWLNALPDAEAETELARCCTSRRWVAQLVAGRPYASSDDLYSAADSAVDALDESDVAEALAGHPRIGERPSGTEGAWSRREQGRVATAADDVLDLLSRGNREYEERFGHVYLVCASGRTAEELLAVLQDRLDNDPETERRVVRRELAEINRIRLARLIGEEEAA